LLLLLIVPLSFEINFILKLWLGNYPDHTASFTLLVLLYTLIQSIKTPRTTVFHAIGELKLVNLTVGTILCSVLPISYFLLKAGYPPESVFIAMIGVLFIAEIASIIVLKKYINYNIRKYIMNVYGKCLLVTIISLPLPLIVNQAMDDGIIRFIIVCVTSTLSICVTIYYLGINEEYRKKIHLFIKEYIYRKK